MNKALFLIVVGLLTLVGGVYYTYQQRDQSKGSDKIVVVKQWELPKELREVSGIAYLENNKLACVQDEDGIIFIFDLNSSSVEDQIEFAGPGDYEAITLVGTTAFVLRSDGVIFEVTNFQDEKRKTIEHAYSFGSNANFEGLGFDPVNNYLLLALKEKSGDEFQPVYGFDLQTKKMKEQPVFKIEFQDPVFQSLDQKISHKILRPSEITIHSQTGDIYILEGVDPKLLILDASGKPKSIFRLNKKDFPQAEGLTFGNSGEIYISNEARGGPASILQITIEN